MPLLETIIKMGVISLSSALFKNEKHSMSRVHLIDKEHTGYNISLPLSTRPPSIDLHSDLGYHCIDHIVPRVVGGTANETYQSLAADEHHLNVVVRVNFMYFPTKPNPTGRHPSPLQRVHQSFPHLICSQFDS